METVDRDKNLYHYSEQSLIIFDRQVKSKIDDKVVFDKPIGVKKLIIVQRSSRRWQLYLALNLGRKDHFTIPTNVCPLLIELIRRVSTELEFIFLKGCCSQYLSDEFSMISLDPASEVSLALKSNVRDYIVNATTAFNYSNDPKRGNAPSVNIGLQTQSAHSHHLSRFCQVQHARPSVNQGSKLNVSAKNALTLIVLEIIGIAEQSFAREQSWSPFENKDRDHYHNKIRLALKQHLVDDIDTNQVLSKHKVSSTPKMPEAINTKFNHGELMKVHNDDLNPPEDDVTLSLSACVLQEDTFPDQAVKKNKSVTKLVKKVANLDQSMSLNFLCYNRKSVHDHAEMAGALDRYLDDESACFFTQACIKLMRLINVPVDYQGFLFEREESFCEIADELKKDPIRFKPHYQIEYFSSAAAFDKSGFNSLFLQVLLSLHYNGLAFFEIDVVGLCIYFGCFANGTMQLAKVWQMILESLIYYLDDENGDFKTLLDILFHADYEVFRQKKSCDTSRDQWQKLIGNSEAFRFQYNGNGCATLFAAIPDLISAINQVVAFGSNNVWKNQKIRDYYIRTLSAIKGMGEMRLNQLLHCLCFSGLLPIACLRNYVSISSTANPGKLLKNIDVKPIEQNKSLVRNKNGTGSLIDENMRRILKNLATLKLTRVSHDYLENLLCEMYRHFSPATKRRLGKVTGKDFASVLQQELSSAEFYQRIQDAKISPNNDLYFKDVSTGNWQHLFRISHDNILCMRPSTVRNNVTSSCILKLNLRIDKEGFFIPGNVSSCTKLDLSSFFEYKM